MKAVLLAAGEGTRLRPLTLSMPKCLVPINGIPLIDFWLNKLTKTGSITKLFINTHYLSEQVQEHIDSQWSYIANLECWYERVLLGTAGTLIENYTYLDDEDLLVIHADNLSIFDIDEFISAHNNRPKQCEITMMLFATDSPTLCGIVELDEKNIVINMHEKVLKPPGNLANAAVYIFSKEVLKKIHKTNISDISTQLLPQYFGKIFTWQNKIYHRDIGNPTSYQLAQQEFRKIKEPATIFNKS